MHHRHGRVAITSRLRARGYDYSSPGPYFITICTQHRICLFGDIRNGRIVLTAAGQVIESWWDSIPRQFPGVQLDERVVMPNHLHGIIMLGTVPELDEAANAPTLSKIVQWFKGNTTNDYMLGVQMEGWPRFAGKLWQTGYYDHIVRSDAEMARLQSYMESNPSQWQQDENNPDSTGL